MKILVLSDTHYKISNPLSVIGRIRPSHVFHLGDMVSDAESIKKAFPGIQMHNVKGNNDFSLTCPYDKIVALEENRFFLTHGHRYGVKSGVEHLTRHAKSLGITCALFGHTHLPFDKAVDGVRLLNPSSYGYILIENGNCEVHKY